MHGGSSDLQTYCCFPKARIYYKDALLMEHATMTKWSVQVSDETDQAVKAFLAGQEDELRGDGGGDYRCEYGECGRGDGHHRRSVCG